MDIIRHVKSMEKKCNRYKKSFDEIVRNIEKQNKNIVDHYTKGDSVFVPNKEFLPGNIQSLLNQNPSAQRKPTHSGKH